MWIFCVKILLGQNNSTNIQWKICIIKWKRILILGAQKEICSFWYLLTVLFNIYLPLRKVWVQMWFTLYHPRSQTFQLPTSRKQNLSIQINEFKTDVYYQENWLPLENKTSVLRSTLNRARLLQESNLVYVVNTTLHHFNPTVYSLVYKELFSTNTILGENSISEMHSNCAHILIVL